MCSLDSIRACASAAFASGKVLKITGFTLPAASSGQTFSRELAGDRRLVGNGARAQRRAGEGQTLAHHRLDVELDLGAAQEGDAHVPALDGQDLELRGI